MVKAEIMLRELLSVCVSAGLHAGNVIREVVHQDVDLDLINKSDGVYDPQTVSSVVIFTFQLVDTGLTGNVGRLQIDDRNSVLSMPFVKYGLIFRSLVKKAIWTTQTKKTLLLLTMDIYIILIIQSQKL
jgi:hypothetical protein